MNVNFLIVTLLITSNLFSQEKARNEGLEFLKRNLALTNKQIKYLETHKAETNINYRMLKEIGTDEKNKKFVVENIEYMTNTNYSIPSYTKENYPGKEDGYPFEWWKDERWIKENMKTSF